MARAERRITTGGGALLAALLLGCGGGEAPPPPANVVAVPAELTAFQLEHGIGPVTEAMTLPAEVDAGLAGQGQVVYEQKCSGCHKMAEKYIGPALGDLLDRRTPAFAMNMILNPQEMIEKHPVVKELLAQTMSFMPNQGLTYDDARAVLEYIRTQHP